MHKNNILNGFEPTRCCGCSSCVNSCPTEALFMSEDIYGFKVPAIIDEKCISCKKCVYSCPYRNNVKLNVPMRTFAALSKDADNVLNSSSGGVFYEIAKSFVNSGGKCFGACFDDNFVVKHICVDNCVDLCKLQKSKYIQSDLLDTFKTVREYLLNGTKILFSGTPCQIAGLVCFLGKKEFANLYLLDVVCHGVPSQKLFNDYLMNEEKKHKNKIKGYEFRAKQKEKNGMNSFHSITIKNKKIIRNWPEDSFNYHYMKGNIYRNSCYECIFARRERASDITLCDYWGWERYHNDVFAYGSSVSGVIVNSNKGLELLNNCIDGLVIESSNYENLSNNNSCLLQPTKQGNQRNEVLSDWIAHGYAYLDDVFFKKNKRTIFKYRLMRHTPLFIIKLLRRIYKNEN